MFQLNQLMDFAKLTSIHVDSLHYQKTPWNFCWLRVLRIKINNSITIKYVVIYLFPPWCSLTFLSSAACWVRSSSKWSQSLCRKYLILLREASSPFWIAKLTHSSLKKGANWLWRNLLFCYVLLLVFSYDLKFLSYANMISPFFA